MKQHIASISIPGKSKTHVAIIPSSFRLNVHSPSDSDKMCISLNDRNGQLIYVTLFPITEDVKDVMRGFSDEKRRTLESSLRNDILEEISRFFTNGKDYNNCYNPVRNLDLDIWREHWEENLESWIEEIM